MRLLTKEEYVSIKKDKPNSKQFFKPAKLLDILHKNDAPYAEVNWKELGYKSSRSCQCSFHKAAIYRHYRIETFCKGDLLYVSLITE